MKPLIKMVEKLEEENEELKKKNEGTLNLDKKLDDLTVYEVNKLVELLEIKCEDAERIFFKKKSR